MNDFIAEPFINPEGAGEENRPAPHEDFERIGPARYYHRLEQGCQEWLTMRLGMLTASEMGKVLTATLKVANNKDTRQHIFELVAQRITRHVDPHYMSWDMERGKLEEVDARVKYGQEIAPVQECGFIINDTLGFDVGYSPDGLVGDIGMIEVKSRVAKYQVQTILEHINVPDADSPIPMEFMLQVQSGLFVTGREWCDFISYSNGLNMAVIRCWPNVEYQTAIKDAAIKTEAKIVELLERYNLAIVNQDLVPTKSKIYPVSRTDYSEEISA